MMEECVLLLHVRVKCKTEFNHRLLARNKIINSRDLGKSYFVASIFASDQLLQNLLLSF